MSNLMVYHGSNMEVRSPSLMYGRMDADFGVGFYVTREAEMAEKWAARKKHSVVNVYQIDLEELTGIEFLLDKAWLDYVCQNRGGNQRINIERSELDYISGATADDKLFAVVEQYESNLIEADTAIECMNAMKIGNQIALISETGIAKLEFLESYILTEDRKQELSTINQQARKDTNRIVEQVLKNRVRIINESPAPLPVIHRKSER